MAIARMSVAVVLQMERGRIEDIRISVGSITPTPQRMSEAEALLKGKAPDEEGLQLAAHQVSETMIRPSGIRPSTSYKKPVVEALFIRAVKKGRGRFNMKQVGIDIPKVDVLEKVLGSARYGADQSIEDPLHLKVVRSEKPHARIVSIQIDEALKVPGVERIFTARDIPGKNLIGIINKGSTRLSLRPGEIYR